MLVIIVIAPTARSPPYLERLDVKLIDKILSVDNITNVDIPSARHGPIIFASSLRLAFLDEGLSCYQSGNAESTQLRQPD